MRRVFSLASTLGHLPTEEDLVSGNHHNISLEGHISKKQFNDLYYHTVIRRLFPLFRAR